MQMFKLSLLQVAHHLTPELVLGLRKFLLTSLGVTLVLLFLLATSCRQISKDWIFQRRLCLSHQKDG